MAGGHDQAREQFETGLRTNPNDDLLLVEYGRFLMYDDRPEAGLARVRETMRPDFTLARFARIFPYRNDATRRGFVASLRAAGIP